MTANFAVALLSANHSSLARPKRPTAALQFLFLAASLFVVSSALTVGRAFAQSSSGSSAGASIGAPSSGVIQGINPSPGDATAQSSALSMPNQAMLYPGEDFRLSPGDLIYVRVFLQPDYQATVRVDSDGNVKLPFIGSVNLKGLSVREAQVLIAERLRTGEFYNNPEVTIQVFDTVNGSVIITGEVRQVVPISTERSLREVLLIAGGLPATASHTVRIVRPGVAEPIVVDLGADLAASAAANIPIHPHDIIQITRASLVYVLGAFAKQGAVPLDQSTPLTLLQLAAISGGINYEGQFNDLRLIRTVTTDQCATPGAAFANCRKVVEVDIKKVRDGKVPDPILQANDIVFLPTNSMKATLKGIGVGGLLAFVSLLYTIQHY